MRVHHLDCGTSYPLFLEGPTRSALRGSLVCHCLLLETASGLVLVDTGYGTRDVAQPRARLSSFLLGLLGPDLDPARTAVSQVRRLGFDPGDVRHVVLTSLEFDHAGGVEDFPHAAVHVLEAEARAAQDRRGPIERLRYARLERLPSQRWCTYRAPGGAPWFGFDCIRGLADLPEEILLVPLPGATPGHTGVAIRSDAGWLLHAGDAYFDSREMIPEGPHVRPGLSIYQRLLETNHAERIATQRRLRLLRQLHSKHVTFFSAHDPGEFARLAGADRAVGYAHSA